MSLLYCEEWWQESRQSRFPNLTWTRIRNTNEHCSSALGYILPKSASEQDQIQQLQNKNQLQFHLGDIWVQSLSLVCFPFLLNVQKMCMVYSFLSNSMIMHNQPHSHYTKSNHLYHYIQPSFNHHYLCSKCELKW